MNLLFLPNAWEDYIYWQKVDKKILGKINALTKDCMRNPFEGLGKPEPLKFSASGCWSRRINAEHRLIYRVDDENIVIHQCRYHYFK